MFALVFIILFCSLPLLSQSASAALVTSRSITMSNSTAGATGVSYVLTFTPVTTAQELIVDFCSDTPIIGSTCAFTNATVPVVSSATSSLGTISFPGSQGHTIRVVGLTMTGGSPYTITFSNVTNPTSVVNSFYARILTYPTSDSSTYVPAATTGGTTNVGTTPTDTGGDALATAQVISVTATVMEQLTFCVSGKVTGVPPTSCTSTTAPAVVLGHGGPPIVLSSSAVDTAPAYTVTSTNALHGVSTNMKDTSSTACGGLSTDGGITCLIPAVNDTGSTLPSAVTMTAGTAAVGMCITPGSVNTTAAQPYNNNGCTKYGLDNTTDSSNVLSTYGSPIFTSSGALNNELDTLNFAATAANTTPAGVYTANYALIATGTF
ncbi:MAG: hypothetical protein ACREF5_02490 [Candidatus Saccharimonadales bacterium]